MQKIELTSKLVLALIAIVVFSAMTVPIVAAPSIPTNFITSAMIKDGEVKTADLANDAVTSEKIKNGEVKAEDIADGVIPSVGTQPNVHTVQGTDEIIPSNSNKIFTVDCPSGEILIGGGYESGPAVYVYADGPSRYSTNSWYIAANNPGPSADTFLIPYAICMELNP